MPNVIQGTDNADFLEGTDDSDIIYGGGGDDGIWGGDGADELFGQGGDDHLICGSWPPSGVTGHGIVDGGGGRDLLDLGAVIVADFVYSTARKAVVVGGIEFTFARIEEVQFGYLNDVIGPVGIDAPASGMQLFMGYGDDRATIAGSVAIFGQGGDDTFVITPDDPYDPASHRGAIVGGEGSDTIVVGGFAWVDLAQHRYTQGGDHFTLHSIENVMIEVLDDERINIEGDSRANTFTVTSDDSFDGSWHVSIRAGGGRDTMIGNQSRDTFAGEDGKDSLDGKGGDDLLFGGAGTDTITGGSGADWFVYDALSDSESIGSADTITDFSHAEGDFIDLGGIDANSAEAGNQAFAFIGAAAFSGTAGELRYKFTSAGNTLVMADVDGDRSADLCIRLIGHHDLVAGDFVL